MIKYLLITLMLSSNITAYASNSYNTSEVDSFVNEMYEKYDYKKDDLKKLFAIAQILKSPQIYNPQ